MIGSESWGGGGGFSFAEGCFLLSADTVLFLPFPVWIWRSRRILPHRHSPFCSAAPLLLSYGKVVSSPMWLRSVTVLLFKRAVRFFLRLESFFFFRAINNIVSSFPHSAARVRRVTPSPQRAHGTRHLPLAAPQKIGLLSKMPAALFLFFSGRRGFLDFSFFPSYL